jgi:hypothetical protein
MNSRKYGRIETIISTSDLAKVNEFPNTWYAHWDKNKKSFYVHGNVRKPDGMPTTVLLHRWILDVTDKRMHVDHINSDTLNNTRNNLNEVTNAENQQNRRKSDNNTSGHTGVYWQKGTNKWVAFIKVDGCLKHLGGFTNKNDAVAARKEAEFLYHAYKRRLSNG